MNGGPYTARRYGGSSRAVDDDESVRAARTTIQSGRTRASAGRTRITPRSSKQTASPGATVVADMGTTPSDERSEERRVGKECRSGGERDARASERVRE